MFYENNVVGGVVQMYKRHIWRYPSRAQKRNHRFLFRTVGHRQDIVVTYVTTYASRYNAYTRIYNFENKKSPVLFGDSFIFGFYHIPGFVGSFS